MTTNHKRFQLRESSQIQLCEFRITDTIVDDDSGDRCIESVEFIDGSDGGAGILDEIGMISQSTDVYSSFWEDISH